MTTHAYSPTPARQTHDPFEIAAKQYVASKAWPQVSRWTRDPQALPGLLKSLQAGDAIVLHSVGCLSERPSEQRSRLLELIGRGVSVHSLDVTGDLSTVLPVLNAAWSTGLALETELDAERERAATREEQMQTEMQEFEAELFAEFSRRFGIQTLRKTMKEAPQSELGLMLKQRREAMGLSQQAVADRLGVGKSSVHRMEDLGAGERIIEYIELVKNAPTQEEQTNAA